MGSRRHAGVLSMVFFKMCCKSIGSQQWIIDITVDACTPCCGPHGWLGGKNTLLTRDLFQLLTILASKEKDTAAKNFAKQLSWQDTLVRLLISDHLDGDNTAPNQPAQGNSVAVPTISESLADEEPVGGAAEGDLPQNTSTPKRPGHLSITTSQDSLLDAPAAHTPTTPMFVQAQEFEDLNVSEEDRSHSMSRSSSTSMEDLSALSQRMASNRHSSLAPLQSPNDSLLSSSESASDIAGVTDLDRRRSSTSITNSESLQRVCDALAYSKDGRTKDAVNQSEEHCQNILICLISIMWKGLDGSDQAVWRVSGGGGGGLGGGVVMMPMHWRGFCIALYWCVCVGM